MKVYQIALAANQPTHTTPGNFFMLLAATAPVDIKFFRRASAIDEKAEQVTAGYKARPVRPADGGKAFDYAEIISATVQTVTVGVAEGEGDFLPPGTATIVQGTAIADNAQVTINTGAAQQIIASATNRKGLRFYADPTNTVSILLGSSGVVTTNGVPLGPGQVWVENDGANAAWYGATSVNGQKVSCQAIT